MRLQKRNMQKEKKRPGGGSGKTQNHLNIYNNLYPPKVSQDLCEEKIGRRHDFRQSQ